MFDLYHTQKRVVRSTAEPHNNVADNEALRRDRAERRASGAHSGRVWIRGFYRNQGGRRVWVRGHWAQAGERYGRSAPE